MSQYGSRAWGTQPVPLGPSGPGGSGSLTLGRVVGSGLVSPPRRRPLNTGTHPVGGPGDCGVPRRPLASSLSPGGSRPSSCSGAPGGGAPAPRAYASPRPAPPIPRPARAVPPPDGGPAPVREFPYVGCAVRVDSDAAVVQRACAARALATWPAAKSKCCGCEGVVAAVDSADGTAQVRFADRIGFWFAKEALSPLPDGAPTAHLEHLWVPEGESPARVADGAEEHQQAEEWLPPAAAEAASPPPTRSPPQFEQARARLEETYQQAIGAAEQAGAQTKLEETYQRAGGAAEQAAVQAQQEQDAAALRAAQAAAAQARAAELATRQECKAELQVAEQEAARLRSELKRLSAQKDTAAVPGAAEGAGYPLPSLGGPPLREPCTKGRGVPVFGEQPVSAHSDFGRFLAEELTLPGGCLAEPQLATLPEGSSVGRFVMVR
eukprot:TRINITY_DN15359_c0_g1_i1.p1 TRINITY_DN15359_c0_g1~~TRINITY_DN15359_c0_g1_i1.p1  ORF type:complete len:436 (+),score=58.80 TRINITY_DN15359_c0_g1_i1:73-1380(+)